MGSWLFIPSAAVVPQVTSTLTDSDQNTANQASYTVTMDIGANTAGSLIVFGAGSRANAARTVTGVTVDGVAMTLVGTANATSGGADISTMFVLARASLPDPTQTNADFVITYSDVMLRATFAAYQILNSGSATPTYSNTTTTVTSGTTSLTDVDCPAKGTTIALVWNSFSSDDVTWSGLTQDFEIQTETAANVFSGASSDFASEQTNITVQTTNTDTSARGGMVAASWGP